MNEPSTTEPGFSIDYGPKSIARRLNADASLTERQREYRYRKAVQRCTCHHLRDQHCGVRAGWMTYPTGCGVAGCTCSEFEVAAEVQA